MTTEAIKYIRAIRNAHKRSYAARYQEWLIGGEVGDPPSRYELSYMAAQAVRMNLHNCLHLDN